MISTFDNALPRKRHGLFVLGVAALLLGGVTSCRPESEQTVRAPVAAPPAEVVVAPPKSAPPPPPAPATPALPQEARALWVNRFEYNSPAKIREIMEKAHRGGFNLIYFQVRGGADAFYRSNIEPCGVLLCGRLGGIPPYDPLEVAVREAHARGLELHAWLNALSGWGSGSPGTCALLTESRPGQPRHILREHPEWAMAARDGKPMPCPNGDEYVYLSPANPGVRTQLARVAADVVRRYPVDGIHLDRIRYPGTRWSYDRASLAEFGKDPDRYPAEWSDYRRELVNRMVRETHDSIRSVRPAAVLSAATWPIYTDRWKWNSSRGVEYYFQDPPAWARGGYLDVAVPMTYYNIHPTYCGFADWLCLVDDQMQRIRRDTGRQVYVGIGVDIPPRKGTEQILRQVRLARERGADGVSFYSYASLDRLNLWPVLAETVFREPAAVPRLSASGP